MLQALLAPMDIQGMQQQPRRLQELPPPVEHQSVFFLLIFQRHFRGLCQGGQTPPPSRMDSLDQLLLP